MINKKKLLSVVVMMIVINSSESTNRAKQWTRRWDSSNTQNTVSCPSTCTCRHRTVRCSGSAERVWTHLHRNIRQLYLPGTKVSSLQPDDLSSLTSLITLSLSNTGLKEILPGSFKSTTLLERLDLSYNQLTTLESDALKSLTRLRVLKVNNNLLGCIDPSISLLTNLEILTLQSNQLANFPENAFSSMPRLRQLRLDDNRIDCSCSVAWLTSFLRRNPNLGVGTVCHQPKSLVSKSVSTLLSYQMKCDGRARVKQECTTGSKCPESCKCSNGVVDCRSLGLTRVPEDLPPDTVELRLEKNLITDIGPNAFKSCLRLKRIDLSRNKLQKVSPESFSINKQLTTLILYDNQLSSLPTSVFHGMGNLHMILLNKNNLSCLQEEIFRDQASLVLLSLYDNNLYTLPSKVFSNLRQIRTLHLGQNPWNCNCHLYWLAAFIKRRSVEASGASCYQPERIRKQRLETLPAGSFTCDESPPAVYDRKTCKVVEKCPPMCKCADGTIDCAGKKLTTIPSHSYMPPDSDTLLLQRNNIETSNMRAHCIKLNHLSKVSLEHNEIRTIGNGDFERCNQVEELDVSYNNIAELSQGSLIGLKKLKKLKILGNYIVCVDQKILNYFQYAPMIEIDLRFLRCSCHYRWLWQGVKQNRIRAFNFKCTNLENCDDTESSPESCSEEFQCPEKCICKDNTIKCNNRNLEKIPENIPTMATEVFLNNNNIENLYTEFPRALVRLQILDLSYNIIQFLAEDAFPNFPKLTSLNLRNNRIQCIQGGAFKKLPSLQIINLQSNDIAGIDPSVFSSLVPVKSLNLEDNPLHCDCRLSWLSSLIKKKSGLDDANTRCNSPSHLAGRSLLHIPNYNLACTGDPEDPVQSRCDPCYSLPCQNGGLCISGMKMVSTRSDLVSKDDSHNMFVCECSSLYQGDRCQYPIDVCRDNPCRNNGSCSISSTGVPKCSCVHGWEGGLCESSTDDCVGHRCRNGGACIDRLNHYECSCADGYAGVFCQEKLSKCQRISGLCQNGGSCISDQSTYGYHCSCLPGFEGVNCSINRAACQPENHQCQNGGQCVRGDNGFSCVCPNQYSGEFCQLEPSVSLLYQKTSPCSHHSCKHGVCLAKPGLDPGYTCQCHAGYSGKNCEYLTTVQLVGQNPYIELDPLFTHRPLNLTVVMKTKERSGVILYHGDRDHLAVELFHGRIRVSLNVGNDPSSTMFSYAVLNDDKPHAVELLLEGKNITMRIDGGLSRSLINNGAKEKLSVARSTFLGGVPPDVGEFALGHWHLRNSTSLKGCIINFFMDEKLIDFLQAAHSKTGVLSGCFKRYLDGTINDADLIVKSPQASKQNKKQKKKGCRTNRCRDTGTRKCLPKGRKDYKCKCRRGFAGRYCERVPTCRKKKSRSFLEENGCRSRKLLTQKLCRGDCHDGSCCKPKKVKKKKVGMICQDGTRYVKSVDVVKRCSCAKASVCKSRKPRKS